MNDNTNAYDLPVPAKRTALWALVNCMDMTFLPDVQDKLTSVAIEVLAFESIEESAA